MFKIKKVIKKEDIKTVKTALNKVNLNKKETNYKKTKSSNLSDDEKHKLSEILKRIRVNSTK
ncbi:MAG: hypothetical protein P1U46_02230 [Patescibacteria group bacterium]|nr:hypothetical protein [Patescibacteria group bacterium]